MNELKPWLSDDGPSEVCGLLRLARQQEPSLQTVEQIIGRMRTEAGVAARADQCEPYGVRVSSAMRRGVFAGVIGLAAAAFAATRINGWPSHSAPAASASAPEPGSGVRAVNGLSMTVPHQPQEAVGQEVQREPFRRARSPALRVRPPGQRTVGDTELPLSPPVAPALPTRVRDALPPDAIPACGSQERALIDEARTLLSRGRPRQALRVIRDYERQCKFRSFAPEALQIRMRAEAATGQRSSARATARMLTERFPSTAPGQEAVRFLAQPNTMSF